MIFIVGRRSEKIKHVLGDHSFETEERQTGWISITKTLNIQARRKALILTNNVNKNDINQ